MVVSVCCFFIKRKTSYELRSSDWSSDVCASDLLVRSLGAVIAACVASATCLVTGTGADLSPVPELALGGTPVLLVNPRAPVATGPVFAAWDGVDRGPLFTGADLRAQLFEIGRAHV